MEKTPPGKNPGVIWANSKITKPDELAWDTFCDWYRDVHIPDVLKTGTVREAFRYTVKEGAGSDDRPHMALYYVDDVETVFGKLKTVPTKHESLPGSHDAFDCIDFDSRIYKFVQLYEKESPMQGQPKILLSTEMTPVDDKDFEDWYREEHLVDGSKLTGWQRTERFELYDPLQTQDATKKLTLLYIDIDAIPQDDLKKAASSEWTQKIVGSLKRFRAGEYHKGSHHVA